MDGSDRDDANTAARDRADAADLTTDATTLRGEAQQDLAQADVVQHMGLPTQAADLRTDADHLTAQATDFERRAFLLDDAANLTMEQNHLFHERADVRVQTTHDEARAAGAEAHLHDVNLTEHEKTELTAVAGAADGEATALHKRDDQITNEIGFDIELAAAEEQAAHEGLPDREWHHGPGQGHPPGVPTQED